MHEVASLVGDIMKTKVFCWIGVIIGLIVAAVFGYNIQHQADFLDVSFEAFINVIIAVGVTYYLTQRKSDDRKTKEFIFLISYELLSTNGILWSTYQRYRILKILYHYLFQR